MIGIPLMGMHYCSLIEKGRVADISAKTSEVEHEATKVDAEIERKIEEIEVIVGNAYGRELVCDSDFRRWLRGVYGEDRYPPDTCTQITGGDRTSRSPKG